MNEIELLRTQLASERRHVLEIASACAAASLDAASAPAGTAPAAWRRACTEYLGWVLDCFDERDLRLGELYARLSPEAADGKARAALGRGGGGRAALDRFVGSRAARQDWQGLAEFIEGPWDMRRAAVEALLATNPRVADWRAFAGIDADSICRERSLHATCRAALPADSTAPPA